MFIIDYNALYVSSSVSSVAAHASQRTACLNYKDIGSDIS